MTQEMYVTRGKINFSLASLIRSATAKNCHLSIVCFLLCGPEEDTDLQIRSNWAWC